MTDKNKKKRHWIPDQVGDDRRRRAGMTEGERARMTEKDKGKRKNTAP